MPFYDINGIELKVGDYCKPTDGQLVKIVGEERIKELGIDVLVGQQVNDPLAFSPLTPEDLAANFSKVTS